MTQLNYLIIALLLNCFFSFSVLSKGGEEENIFISLSGSELGKGSIDDPFNSVRQALDLTNAFKNKSVNIFFREGTYFLEKKVEIGKIDDRLKNYPLTISAYKSEKVVLTGAKALPYWNKVVDSNILRRLPKKSKKNVYVTNLREYGINNFGSAKSNGVELYFNDKKMHLSRYPNQGQKLLVIDNLVEPDTQVIRGYKGSEVGKFYYEGDVPERWTNEENILMSGFWFWDWKDETHEVNSIDITSKVISLKQPYHHYGYRKGQEYFAYNILAELDSPYEWFLDRNTGKLYFYPNVEITKSNAPKLAVTKNLVELNNASNITIKNLTFSYARNNGIIVQNGENNNITNVVIKHIGNHGIRIENSINSSISSSHVYSIGASAITLNGGDRKSLTSANICAINNKVHAYALVKRTYQPGISIDGVGNCAKHNEIFDAPHFAIFFQGNNHNIEYNHIHDVVKQSNDAGAIYAGRDWTSRGTVIKHNYLHDIQGYQDKGAKGIYLDDEFSGVTITGNIFDNVYDAVFIGGGRDNIVDNNLFVNSFRSIYIDARGVGWAEEQLNQFIKKLNEVPYLSNVWQEQYPKLSNVLTLNPRFPVGNEINNNIFFDPKWNFVIEKAKSFTSFNSNHHLVGSSLPMNYQIKTPLKGFSNIPFNEIGVK